MHFIRYQLPAILWFIVIFFLSSFPPSVFPTLSIPYSDKLVHICIFFILCALVDRALLHQNKFPRLTNFHIFVALAVVILYGLFDEFHQSYIPGRSTDLFDATADAIGGCLYLLFYSFRKIRIQR
jgi:VanZ family protein